MSGFVIAVDGPAASGKGTVAAGLAAEYRLPHLDTGLLYRAVGWTVLQAGQDLDDEFAAMAAARALEPARLDNPALRGRDAGEAASRVAVHLGVRGALLAFQRDFAAREPGAVIDGRDIGTVIAPDAPAKLFVTASAQARAAPIPRRASVCDDSVWRVPNAVSRSTRALSRASDTSSAGAAKAGAATKSAEKRAILIARDYHPAPPGQGADQ